MFPHLRLLSLAAVAAALAAVAAALSAGFVGCASTPSSPAAAAAVLDASAAPTHPEPPKTAIAPAAPNVQLGLTDIHVIGNSITWHVADSTIGWSGNWGMASSAQAKDFAHMTAAAFNLPVTVINVADLERNAATAADQTKLAAAGITATTAVVVELGDNVTNTPDAIAAFATSYNMLLDAVATGKSLTCTSTFWNNAAVNAVLQAACTAHKGRYENISSLYTDVSNVNDPTNTFSDAGVAAHPHDWAMAHIALAVEDGILHH